MIKWPFSYYSRNYNSALIYMLQSTEYQPTPYLRWYWRSLNFNKVAKRRTLTKTKAAWLLLLVLTVGSSLQYLVGLLLIFFGPVGHTYLGIAIFLSTPIIWAHLIVLPLVLGRLLIVNPREKRMITESRTIFKNHKAIKIAVAGSYGKTTMKEILLTVLGEGKKVVATPANKNVASSHALFARTLSGDEEVIIIEFGEGKPGDVEQFTATVQPDIAVITGIAPAHLDKYPSMDAAAKDIFSVTNNLEPAKVYVNAESDSLLPYVKPGFNEYSHTGVSDWKVSSSKLTPIGLEFNLRSGNTELHLTSALLGEHQIGPLSAAAAIASSLGLSDQQIEQGVAKTKAFKHRMQTYELSGATIIDDTYNGNLEGIKAGLALLKDLPAKRKIYVTPGLVDQGRENERVHKTIGELIAKASPDKVVLMKNSVTKWIESGLTEGKFKGELTVEADPLTFYTNLDKIVSAGDLVLMQNDWTDNYA